MIIFPSIKPACRLSVSGPDTQAILIQPAFRLLFRAPIATLPELARHLTTGGYDELRLDRDPDGDRIVYDPTLSGGSWPEFQVGGLLTIGGHALVVAGNASTRTLRAPARSLADVRRLISFSACRHVPAVAA